ncbi:MAG TPA: PAS domain S-box protein [Arenicellales bacterium]|nr:PAS domain S-box protein [Arenicellales bacterium]
MRLTPSTRAVRVALIYLAFGTLWIIASDFYLDRLDVDAALLTSLQTVKGASFVLVTALVFFYLARRELQRQARADHEAGRRERALRTMFEATFNHAAVGITHHATDGRFLKANRAFSELSGYSEDELALLRFRDITHPDDVETVERQISRLVSGAIESFNLDKRYIRKDGGICWASVTVSLVPDVESGGDRFLAVISDISDRKKAEAALQASEARFRALVEQSITGIYVFDREAFRYVNDRLASMFGYAGEELIDRLGPGDLIAPEDRGTVQEQIQRRFDRAVESAHYVARGLRKDGTRIWLELHGSLIELDGRPAITGTVLDITERVEADQRLRESEARFRAIYDGVNDAILILDPEAGDILDANRRAWDMLGHRSSGMGRLDFVDISAAGREEAQSAVMRRLAAARGGQAQIFEWQLRSRGGDSLWVEINMRAAHIGGVERILVLARDITERRRSEARLRLTSKVFESTREGVVITDTAQRIVSVNPAFTEITGYGEDEVLGRTPVILQSGLHDRDFYRAMWSSVTRTDHWQGEIWNRRRNGETYPEWLTISAVRDERNTITNYVGVFSDVSRLKDSEAEARRLAHYDPLTGLPNRVLFTSLLEHAISRRPSRESRLAVIFCGLDRFRHINESVGYAAGDELLRAVADMIRGRLRRGDTLARFAGDEYVVLVEADAGPEEIDQMAQSILEVSSTSVELSSGHTVFPGVSIGVSLCPEDGEDAGILVTHANAAMQQAKSEGRQTYRYYRKGLTEHARERLSMEARLRRAVENQELEVHFQPFLELARERLTGAEVLCRWTDPDVGRIPPDRFIPLAEDTGLIVPLGRWVLAQACRQAASWSTGGFGDLKVAVNLSGRQFQTGDLTRDVASVLEDTGLRPDRLELEITESVLMEHGERTLQTLKELRELGVGVSMDDFGTGYSSLAYLKQFAINRIKIDRAFINDLPDDADDVELVSSMIGLAHNLGLRVLAEGVETTGQLEFLSAAGCDEAQGYLISAPLPVSEFESFVSDFRAAGGFRGLRNG